MKTKSSVSFEELYNAQKFMFDVNYERWIHDVLFTFNWWFLIFLTFVPVLIWWKLLDKSRIFEILFVGLSIGSLATLMDVTGYVFSAWTYGYKIIQMIPPAKSY